MLDGNGCGLWRLDVRSGRFILDVDSSRGCGEVGLSALGAVGVSEGPCDASRVVGRTDCESEGVEPDRISKAEG